ncbi:MAG: universal stress protein [Dehalococcoidia bacterium]|nr:universal stress protein [Dehalococcoidia bacterium]
MYTRALIATDLSDACDKMIRCSLALGDFGTTDVVLLYCFNIRDVGTLAPRLEELIEPRLQLQAEVLRQAGFTVVTKMSVGLPHIEIGRQSEEHGCDLIVVGSHGQSMAGELLLGNVARGVIESATLPVLVVRLKLTQVQGKFLCEEHPCDFLEHVLYPTDFSENAAHAFDHVKALCRSGARCITLLHVQDKVKIGGYLVDRLDEFNRIDTERLALLEDELRKLGAAQVIIDLRYGSPRKEIVERTRGDDVTLVVMGTHGRGYISRLFTGGVSNAVARHSTANVLLVPMPR